MVVWISEMSGRTASMVCKFMEDLFLIAHLVAVSSNGARGHSINFLPHLWDLESNQESYLLDNSRFGGGGAGGEAPRSRH